MLNDDKASVPGNTRRWRCFHQHVANPACSPEEVADRALAALCGELRHNGGVPAFDAVVQVCCDFLGWSDGGGRVLPLNDPADLAAQLARIQRAADGHPYTELASVAAQWVVRFLSERQESRPLRAVRALVAEHAVLELLELHLDRACLAADWQRFGSVTALHDFKNRVYQSLVSPARAVGEYLLREPASTRLRKPPRKRESTVRQLSTSLIHRPGDSRRFH